MPSTILTCEIYWSTIDCTEDSRPVAVEAVVNGLDVTTGSARIFLRFKYPVDDVIADRFILDSLHPTDLSTAVNQNVLRPGVLSTTVGIGTKRSFIRPCSTREIAHSIDSDQLNICGTKEVCSRKRVVCDPTNESPSVTWIVDFPVSGSGTHRFSMIPAACDLSNVCTNGPPINDRSSIVRREYLLSAPPKGGVADIASIFVKPIPVRFGT
jgi:hypothetical protein